MLTHSHLCLSSLSCSLAHSHPLSHTHTLSPPPSRPPLVCTHSNCVSSHLITLSSTLPTPLACLHHTCTHMHTCTERSIPALSHVVSLSTYLTCALTCVKAPFFMSFIDNPALILELLGGFIFARTF